MGVKKHGAEEIIHKLREAEVDRAVAAVVGPHPIHLQAVGQPPVGGVESPAEPEPVLAQIARVVGGGLVDRHCLRPLGRIYVVEPIEAHDLAVGDDDHQVGRDPIQLTFFPENSRLEMKKKEPGVE